MPEPTSTTQKFAFILRRPFRSRLEGTAPAVPFPGNTAGHASLQAISGRGMAGALPGFPERSRSESLWIPTQVRAESWGRRSVGARKPASGRGAPFPGAVDRVPGSDLLKSLVAAVVVLRLDISIRPGTPCATDDAGSTGCLEAPSGETRMTQLTEETRTPTDLPRPAAAVPAALK